MLIFDEYAESQSIKDTFSGADIHSTVAFCYQKLRKENGAVGTIVQSMAQLPDNEYTKGIIANTQLLYVLPANEVVYDQTIEAFHIKNRSHINLMKSIRNDFTGTRPYSEIFLRFMDNYATVVRLELSPEKLLAFQTDGEKWNRLQEIYREVGSLETAIEQYKQLKHKDYETDFLCSVIMTFCLATPAFSQFVVSDPALTQLSQITWAKELKQAYEQFKVLDNSRNILTESLDLYRKVSGLIQNSKWC